MNGTEENDDVRQTLRQAMPDDLPTAVAERLEKRLAAFGERFNVKSPVSGGSPIRSVFRGRLARWATACCLPRRSSWLPYCLFHKPGTRASQPRGPRWLKRWPRNHGCISWPRITTEQKWKAGSPSRRSVLTGRLIKAGSKWAVGGDPEGRVMYDTLSQNTMDWYDPKNNLIVRASDDPFREGANPFPAIFSAFVSAGSPGGTIDTARFTLVPKQKRVRWWKAKNAGSSIACLNAARTKT